MYSVEFSSRALREFRILRKSNEKIYSAASFAIEDLKLDPLLGDPLKRELTGFLSYRINGYRIIYKVIRLGRLILIAKIGPRSTVYS